MNQYIEKMVQDLEDSGHEKPPGFLGKNFDHYSKEDLIGIIHILYAGNEKTRERLSKFEGNLKACLALEQQH